MPRFSPLLIPVSALLLSSCESLTEPLSASSGRMYSVNGNNPFDPAVRTQTTEYPTAVTSESAVVAKINQPMVEVNVPQGEGPMETQDMVLVEEDVYIVEEEKPGFFARLFGRGESKEKSIKEMTLEQQAVAAEAGKIAEQADNNWEGLEEDNPNQYRDDYYPIAPALSESTSNDDIGLSSGSLDSDWESSDSVSSSSGSDALAEAQRMIREEQESRDRAAGVSAVEETSAELADFEAPLPREPKDMTETSTGEARVPEPELPDTDEFRTPGAVPTPDQPLEGLEFGGE